ILGLATIFKKAPYFKVWGFFHAYLLIKNIKTSLVYKSHFIHKQTQLSPTMFELSRNGSTEICL
ncbi:hypothetical protein CHH38_07355, partial [Acinetobacter nosocomialis]|uniref:hypothetical protein n=1 Tax=Acinetobacter nosocomialis TaxID=106654 RepID=UPI000C063E4D